MTDENPDSKISALLTSSKLKLEHTYRRKDLRQLFQITDSSVNNGIFRPKGYNSVWLFVTETKTSDRTQYKDELLDDVLFMEGQLKGGTDYLIREHLERGLELLLFYRKRKYEYPEAAFMFMGRFIYEGHEGALPTRFTLRKENSNACFGPTDIKNLRDLQQLDLNKIISSRSHAFASVMRRQGQTAFRNKLIKAYEGQCAITRCKIEALLDAAHIFPYQGKDTNVISNGLLLRTDIHRLFDIGLLWIVPDTLRVKLSSILINTEYYYLDGTTIFHPRIISYIPNAQALQAHIDFLQK